MEHVNEYRQLRDAYGARAAAALNRAYPGGIERWQRVIEYATADPLSQLDALELYAEGIYCFCDWGIVHRFKHFAVKVWEMEVQELYGRLTTNQNEHRETQAA